MHMTSFLLLFWLQNALDQGCFCSKGCWAHLDCVLATLKDIAAGCAHLHQNGVVHADLSSSNVLLFARKPAVVADMEDVALDEGYSRQLSKYTLVSTIDEPALQHVAKVCLLCAQAGIAEQLLGALMLGSTPTAHLVCYV